MDRMSRRNNRRTPSVSATYTTQVPSREMANDLTGSAVCAGSCSDNSKRKTGDAVRPAEARVHANAARLNEAAATTRAAAATAHAERALRVRAGAGAHSAVTAADSRPMLPSAN